VGEKQNRLFQFSFNASLKLDFQGSQITSDGGGWCCRTGSAIGP
jgi:hypothetical protein